MANELKPYLQRVNPNDELTNKIVDVLKRTLPDNGAFFKENGEVTANLFDFVGLITGMVASVATRGAGDDILTLVVSGKSFSLDSSTNILNDHSNVDAIADGIKSALVATGVGVGATLLAASFTSIGVVACIAAVGFFAGNAIGSFAPDFSDRLFGSDVFATFEIEKGYTVFSTNSLFEYAMRDYWDDGNNTGMKYYFDQNYEFEFITTHQSEEFSFHFKDKTFTFSEPLEDILIQNGNFEELLKYLPENPGISIVDNENKNRGKLPLTNHYKRKYL